VLDMISGAALRGVDKAVKIDRDELPAIKEVDAFPSAEQHPHLDPARVAVYGSSEAPRVLEVSAERPDQLFDLLTAKILQISKPQGGRVPRGAVQEVVENLIHADCRQIVVSILEKGSVIRVSDQGPGITDKKKALQHGFTTATAAHQNYIKGVGSGLPVAARLVESLGGSLTVEDNLDRGTVITLSAGAAGASSTEAGSILPALSKRQKKVFFIIVEMGAVGPSQIAAELSVGLSTAYRDVQALEELGLVTSDGRGKRSLTELGVQSLDSIIHS
jgi:DNA-binding transcriptional ArsR family regulator